MVRFKTMNPTEQLDLIQRLCPCCGVDPATTPLGVCCNNMDLADLGAGYVMYFKMIIFFGVIWVFYLVINAVKVLANTKKGYCTSKDNLVFKANSTEPELQYIKNGLPPCSLDWVTLHSQANYGIMNVDTDEKTFVLLFFIAYWFFLSICKQWLKKTNKQIDNSNDTPSDWTLIVRGLPSDEPAEQIKANFEAFGANGKEVAYVKKVNIAYNCEEYVKKFEKINKKKREMKLMQVKEHAKAMERMKERLEKDEKKDDKKSGKEFFAKRPDKKDYSPEFQKKFEQLAQETAEVGDDDSVERDEANHLEQS